MQEILKSNHSANTVRQTENAKKKKKTKKKKIG
jgi:hypothetical protein